MVPLLVLSMYQWTLHDSWLSILLSVITFLAVFAAIAGISFVLLRGTRVGSAAGLYDYPTLVAYSPLVEQYHAHRFYLFFPFIVLPLIKAIVIAAGKNNGLAQLIVLLVLELSTVLMPIILRPYKTRGGDVFSTYLGIVRLVCTGLMIAFLERLNVGAIMRVVIGCVIGVIFCINIVVIVVNILIHLYHHARSPTTEGGESDKSMTECGTDRPSWGKRSSDTFINNQQFTFSQERPRNPTPHQNETLDPNVNESYPENTPPSTSADHFSHAQRDSATSLGSILPRRFDITPLSSPESFEFASTIGTPTSYSSHSSVTLGHGPSPVDRAYLASHCSNDRALRS